MQKRILIALCLVLVFASATSAQTRLGLAMGGGVSWPFWEEEFAKSVGTVYNFYGGSEFRLGEKWLIRNLGQGVVGKGKTTVNEENANTKLSMGMWTVSAMRMWEVQPKLELGLGAMAGLGTFAFRLEYEEEAGADPLAPNLRELTDKLFVPLAPVVTLRYQAGIQTFTIEALYLFPQRLEHGLKSGLQLQFGLSYDLGY